MRAVAALTYCHARVAFRDVRRMYTFLFAFLFGAYSCCYYILHACLFCSSGFTERPFLLFYCRRNLFSLSLLLSTEQMQRNIKGSSCCHIVGLHKLHHTSDICLWIPQLEVPIQHNKCSRHSFLFLPTHQPELQVTAVAILGLNLVLRSFNYKLVSIIKSSKRGPRHAKALFSFVSAFLFTPPRLFSIWPPGKFFCYASYSSGFSFLAVWKKPVLSRSDLKQSFPAIYFLLSAIYTLVLIIEGYSSTTVAIRLLFCCYVFVSLKLSSIYLLSHILYNFELVVYYNISTW